MTDDVVESSNDGCHLSLVALRARDGRHLTVRVDLCRGSIRGISDTLALSGAIRIHNAILRDGKTYYVAVGIGWRYVRDVPDGIDHRLVPLGLRIGGIADQVKAVWNAALVF